VEERDDVLGLVLFVGQSGQRGISEGSFSEAQPAARPLGANDTHKAKHFERFEAVNGLVSGGYR